MAFNNAEILIRGYIGSDVNEMHKDKNGKAYCRFSVCVVTNKNNSTWYQVNVYGDLGLGLIKKNMIVKGHECMVKGLPAFNSFFNRKTQKQQVNFGIFADWVFIMPKILDKASHHDDLAKANEIDESVPDEVIDDLEAAPF